MSEVWGLGSGVWGLGSWVWHLGSGVWGLGFGVWGLGSGVWGLGFGVWGLGSGVWGLGFWVWGLGSGVWGCTLPNAASVFTASSSDACCRRESGAMEDRAPIPGHMSQGYFDVQLPEGVTCEHCVFQFRYRGGECVRMRTIHIHIR